MAYQTNLGLSRFKWIVVCITALLALCSSTTKANYEQQLRTDSNAKLPISDDKTTQVTKQDGDNGEERGPNFEQQQQIVLGLAKQHVTNIDEVPPKLQLAFWTLRDKAKEETMSYEEGDKKLLETLKQMHPLQAAKILDTDVFFDSTKVGLGLIEHLVKKNFFESPQECLKWLKPYIMSEHIDVQQRSWELWHEYVRAARLQLSHFEFFVMVQNEFKSMNEMQKLVSSFQSAGMKFEAKMAIGYLDDIRMRLGRSTQ